VSDLTLSRRAAGKVKRLIRPPRPEDRPEYIANEPNPTAPDVLPSFRFFAVLGSWMEEDIVESNVRNAFAQGVEKVFLVDNASTDATVERAVAAGASLALSYRTDTFQEEVRRLFMNSVMAQESLAAEAAHVWWLFLDADEFPEGPDGMTIAEYLATLDRRFRLVGSTYYNHFPTTKPANIPGVHPVDLQPMCQVCAIVRKDRCGQLHWKHPLQRFDRDGVFLEAGHGFHTGRVHSKERLYEPVGGIVTHHIQYREEAATRARLEAVCSPTRFTIQTKLKQPQMARRLATLDAVYNQRWHEVDNRGEWNKQLGVTLTRWNGPGTRWYAAESQGSPGSSVAPPS
jgi:hypothetical protein